VYETLKAGLKLLVYETLKAGLKLLVYDMRP
jgi:hypothetical protein